MLFVSKHPGYVHGIRGEEAEIIRLQSGREQLRMLVPPLDAVFRKGVLTFAEREEALRRFNAQGDHAFGATPHMHSGMISSPGAEGVAHEGYDPGFALSSFDTDQDIDYNVARAHTPEARAAVKELFEQRLTDSPDNGSAFLLIESRVLQPPWPTYDVTPMEKVLPMVSQAGFDLDAVIAYESENAKRESLLKALSSYKAKLAAKADAEAQEKAELEVSIPR